MSEVNLATLEKQRENASKLADMAEVHDRLHRNKDFRKLILEAYTVTECARYVHQSCDPMLTERQRADALAMAQAAGHLKRFLQISRTMCEQAIQDLPEIDAAIVQLREMGDE